MRMKLIFSLLLLPLAIACSGGNNEPIPYVKPERETRESTLYLGLSETKEYTPLKDVEFEVNVLDTTLATYDKTTKCFTSYQKVGVTTANFTNSDVVYVVTINVRDDGTAPLFKLDESYINLNKGDNFTVNASLTYRDVDVFNKCDGLHFTRESEGEEVSKLTVKDNTIEVATLDKLGEDRYTVYVSYLDHLLSKTLTVKIIEDNAFVVVGARLEYDEDGPVYNIPLYNYNSNKINLKSDLAFSKSGTTVSYGDVNIIVDDTSVAKIVNDELDVLKADIAHIIIKYNSDSIAVKVNAYKPVIETITQSLNDNKFPLNLDCKLEGNPQKRVYTGLDSEKWSFNINTEGHNFIKANSIKVNGVTRYSTDEHQIGYNNGQVTIPASLFDIDCYGELACELIMEASEYYVQYNMNIFFITKVIKTVSDFNLYIPMKYQGESVIGYYTLGADIDFNGYNPGAAYVSDAAKETVGFKATLDGTKKADNTGAVVEKYQIKNMKSSPYGLSICMGKGAIIKNVDFTNVNFDNKEGASLFGRFMFGVTVVNVNVNFNSNSDLTHRPNVTDPAKPGDPNGTGIFSSQKVQDCSFVKLIIDADGREVRCLCGKNATNNNFTDCTLYAEKLVYYYTGTAFDNVNFEPTGGARFNNDIPGLTVTNK